MFFGQRASEDESVRDTLIGTVAGVVALVPQGLVLLLSMAQAVAVIRLGRKKVLVQQLQAVETLARVTVLATDKTGTLTDGQVTLERVEPLDGASAGAAGGDVSGNGDANGKIEQALAAIAAADEFPNATMKALQQAYEAPPGWTVANRIPFDSSHKYSAVDFGADGSWYVGAPEILLPHGDAATAEVEDAGRPRGFGSSCSPAPGRCRRRASCRPT